MTAAFFLTLAVGAIVVQQPPLHLRVSMISLGVKDAARSIKFYTETLGLELVGNPGEVAFVRAGDITIVLNQPAGKAARETLAGSVEVIFPVDSVAASYKALQERGCSFVAVPHEITTNMWAATFTDPDGHMLTVLGPK
jgi:catechol 2,3-dioxygenase-like lactoylglutathione lyase family enzyme